MYRVKGHNVPVHHIQRKIISKLRRSPTLGYAQMRPAGIESNHFAYHLDQLLKAGYIAKKERKYFLTNKGKALSDHVSHEKIDIRIQPQIALSVFVKNDAGKTAMFKHNFQPYLDLYGSAQGRLHYDEKIADAAARELKEKTGIAGVALAHRGIAYVRALSGDETISILLLHVFSGSVAGEPALTAEAKNGEPFWMDSPTLKPEECMPGFKEIEALLSAKGPDLFFTEIDATLA